MDTTFVPTHQWQDVPPDAILPPGCQIRMHLETGNQQARWPNGNGHDAAPADDLGEAYAAVEAWPALIPLPKGLPPVDPFPIELLPGALAPWIGDVTERMQVPADYVAVAAMTALGSVLGRQIGIYPKRHDDWLVVPNLWGAVIGRPGLLKTPALEEALRPLRAMEREAKEEFDAETKAWEARQEVDKELKKLRANDIRAALKSNQSPEHIARAIAEEQGADKEPVRRRFLTNDATVPKLGEILRDNPSGVLVFRDELAGWLRSMETEGREADRSFYLEAWNGTGRFTYDRIGRGTIDIEAACVSVLGGIQPGPLLAYLEGRAWGGAGDDGLLQRLQLAVWPDQPSTWRNVDRWPNTAARDRAAAVFERFAAIQPATLGADALGSIPAFHFDDAAQETFDAWRASLEERLRRGDLHPAFEAHLSKYRSLLPSLALVCHLADDGTGPVRQLAFDRAEAWCDYLESHARRIYDALLRADQSAANALGEHLEAGDLPSPFKIRDVYRRHWAGLSTRQAAQDAVEILCDLGWLRGEETKTGGRPTGLYHINPAVKRPS